MLPTNSIKNTIWKNSATFPMLEIRGKNHTGTAQHLQFRQQDKGRHTELIFKGINYRAAVWLNGNKLPIRAKWWVCLPNTVWM